MMARPAMQAIYGHGPWALVDVASNAGCSRCDGPLLRLHFGNRKVMECQEGREFQFQPDGEIREGKIEEPVEVDEPCCFCFKKRRTQDTDWTYFRP